MAEETAPVYTQCTACGDTLVPVFEGHDTVSQYENALIIGFYGGYGMFTDNIEVVFGDEKRLLPGSPCEEAIICHSCAHALCKAVPWINRLIEPLNSHAHSYDKDWTGHEGWDLPHKDQ